MRDQGSVDKNESPEIKYDRALSLFTESVLAPDHQFIITSLIMSTPVSYTHLTLPTTPYV